MFKHGFPPEWSTLKKLIWLVGSGIAGASAIWKTVTGTLIHITDALASPMQKCEVSLEPIQEGSGDPSPTNVRPITGWTGCEVNVVGKNRFKVTATSTTVNGVTLTVNSDGTISCTGKALGLVTLALGSVTLEGGEYFISGCPEGGSSSTYRMYGSWGGNEIGSGVTRTFANGTTVSLQIAIHSGVETGFTFKPMICLSADSHEFEPYSGTTLSVTFPNTVYGGKYEFVSGEGDSSFANFVYNGSFLPNIASTAYIGQNSSHCYVNVGLITGKRQTSPEEDICNELIIGNTNIDANANVYSREGEALLHIRVMNSLTGISSSDDVNTAKQKFADFFAEYPLQYCYRLKDTTGISDTPTPVNTLQGENNIWADCGDVEVTYKARA